MKLPIYLDYAATTPVDARVAEQMANYLTLEGQFGNPSSSHSFGRAAAKAIEIARQQVADLINADSNEIIWTSGATEANNLAIKGVAEFYKNKGKHIITSLIEHEAVIEPCKYLESLGFEITYLKPEHNGIINLQKIKAAIRPDTILVSIMQVNNELGVIQDIAAIGKLVKENNIFFHVDAAQSLGKMSIDLQKLPVDLMSFSSHKIYGPKGAGALYRRQKSKINLIAQIHGGGQEQGLRSGTLATHQIVGFGAACQIAKQELPEESKRIKKLREQLWSGIKNIKDINLNSRDAECVPGILNIAFAGIDVGLLNPALKDLAVSSGSACHANSLEPSRVLKAIGLSDNLAYSSIRFSIGRYTTEEELVFVINKINMVSDTHKSQD